MKRWTITIMSLLLLSMLSAFSGHISENTLWNQDVILTGDVWIDANVILTIGAGVNVTVTRIDQDADGIGDIDIFVDGRILINGTQADPVTFTSNEDDPAPDDWGGFQFRNQDAVYSTLNWTDIFYAHQGITIDAKYVTFNDCSVSWCGDYGVKVENSYNGLATFNGFTIYECAAWGFGVNANGRVNADGLISSSSGSYGIIVNGSGHAVFANSRGVSSAETGLWITNSSPTFDNCDFSYNETFGISVYGASSTPSFEYCTVYRNDGYGVLFAEGSAGSMEHSSITENKLPGFLVMQNSFPAVNYCNIYDNATDASQFLIEEAIPTNELYRNSNGNTNMYTIMLPVYFITHMHISGYADHDYSYDDYAMYVRDGNSTVICSYLRPNTSSDTSFDFWETISSTSLSNQLFLELNTYSVYNPWARVSEIRYDIGGVDADLFCVNMAGEVDFDHNWWGQINGVDGLVQSTVDGTVSYENLATAEYATAGATLPNIGPYLQLTSPDSLMLNPTTLTISWLDADVDDGATIDLYYDDGLDATGTLIVADLPEDGPADSYVWDFTDTPHSIYYIYGVIDDGVNPPVVSYAPDQVQVGPLSAGIDTDVHASAGETFIIPVRIINSIPYYNIISFQFRITYDFNLLTALSVQNTGTLSESWNVNYNTGIPGQIEINGYDVTPLSTDGVLVNIEMLVDDGAVDYENSPLTFAEFIFNDATETVVQNDGLFTTLNPYNISGNVDYFTPNRTGIPNVDLDLTGDAEDLVTTDASGFFTFPDHLTGNYVLRPWCDTVVPELAVSPYDAALTARFALGLEVLTTHQQIAADVNLDGTPTVYDAALMAQYSVGIIEEFDAGRWAFLPDSTAFELTMTDAVKNFTAIAYGDPSGNYPDVLERTVSEPVAVTLTRDETGRCRLSCGNDLPFYALGLSVTYDPEALSFAGIEEADGLADFTFAVNQNGNNVRVGGFGTEQVQPDGAAVHLVFEFSDGFDASTLMVDYLQFDETDSGWFDTTDADGNVAPPVVTALGRNFPNPFNPETTIAFDLAKPGMVQIDIYNVLGQRVDTLVREQMPAGRHAIVWKADDFASGIYFCRMKTGEYSGMRKLLLLK